MTMASICPYRPGQPPCVMQGRACRRVGAQGAIERPATTGSRDPAPVRIPSARGLWWFDWLGGRAPVPTRGCAYWEDDVDLGSTHSGDGKSAGPTPVFRVHAGQISIQNTQHKHDPSWGLNSFALLPQHFSVSDRVRPPILPLGQLGARRPRIDRSW